MHWSGLTSYLKRQRHDLELWLDGRGLSHTFSLASYGLHQSVARLVEAHARGKVLDAGSGRAPYRQRLVDRGQPVVTIDIENRDGRVTHVADIQDMPMIERESVATVICTEVLEHVPAPERALREIARVLEPGGTLILSVPYLTPIHEAPRDFYRYTRYALENMIHAAGLELELLEEVGGMLAFLGHGASMALLGSVGAIRGLRGLSWAVNYAVLIRSLAVVDALVGFADIYPCNYVLVARKPSTAPGLA